MQIFCWRSAQQKNGQQERAKKLSYVNITVQPGSINNFANVELSVL